MVRRRTMAGRPKKSQARIFLSFAVLSYFCTKDITAGRRPIGRTISFFCPYLFLIDTVQWHRPDMQRAWPIRCAIRVKYAPQIKMRTGRAKPRVQRTFLFRLRARISSGGHHRPEKNASLTFPIKGPRKRQRPQRGLRSRETHRGGSTAAAMGTRARKGTFVKRKKKRLLPPRRKRKKRTQQQQRQQRRWRPIVARPH